MNQNWKHRNKLELELLALYVSQLLSIAVQEVAILTRLRDSIWMCASGLLKETLLPRG